MYIKENYLKIIDDSVKLKNKVILEIGCGGGNKTVQIAKMCKMVVAIDNNLPRILDAKKENQSSNITYTQSSANPLLFEDKSFDVVIFTLSLHHLSKNEMRSAIKEAIRVTVSSGIIIFLEPTNNGSFFEAAIIFGSSDGDERLQKAYAYFEILNTKGYREIYEGFWKTTFLFDSKNDFVVSLRPKINLNNIDTFLKKKNYRLEAEGRVNIFEVSHSI
jgi:ubiquinone/menaquinone biosynthesis C-methylase UbiE